MTIFGESAGAMSIGDLYFGSNLETLVRAAVSNKLLCYINVRY